MTALLLERWQIWSNLRMVVKMPRVYWILHCLILKRETCVLSLSNVSQAMFSFRDDCVLSWTHKKWFIHCLFSMLQIPLKKLAGFFSEITDHLSPPSTRAWHVHRSVQRYGNHRAKKYLLDLRCRSNICVPVRDVCFLDVLPTQMWSAYVGVISARASFHSVEEWRA